MKKDGIFSSLLEDGFIITANREPHIGRSIKRIREMLQVKQSPLAHTSGEDWNQKKVSYPEDEKTMDDELLAEVTEALKVPVESMKNFDEEATVSIVASNNNERDNSSAVNLQCTFNPLEKLMEVIEERKKWYERLVEVEREKVALMERLIAERK